MRATLLLLACVAAAAGCDGLLGIEQHTLAAEAGPRGDGGDADGESGMPAIPGEDGGARLEASVPVEQ